MTELIVVGFDDEFKADEVLLDLIKKQRGYLIDLEDAAITVHKADGKVIIKHGHVLSEVKAAHGSFWGLLIGTLLCNPLVGTVVGGTAGAVVGSLKHIGIKDEFIRDLGTTLQRETSALFILVREITPETVLEELKMFDGKLLRTSLSHDDEAKLREALEAKE